MALCFFIFSMCILLLSACVGRWAYIAGGQAAKMCKCFYIFLLLLNIFLKHCSATKGWNLKGTFTHVTSEPNERFKKKKMVSQASNFVQSSPDLSQMMFRPSCISTKLYKHQAAKKAQAEVGPYLSTALIYLHQIPWTDSRSHPLEIPKTLGRGAITRGDKRWFWSLLFMLLKSSKIMMVKSSLLWSWGQPMLPFLVLQSHLMVKPPNGKWGYIQVMVWYISTKLGLPTLRESCPISPTGGPCWTAWPPDHCLKLPFQILYFKFLLK